MTRANELPESIAWYEGMLLWPQHFQQWTRRQEALLHFHALAMAPYHWGVRDLHFDRVMLVRGMLRVLELEAVLPDGLVVSHLARQGGEDLELDLKPYADELKERSLTIHLAVARVGTSSPAFNGAVERYESYEGPAVTNEITGERSPGIRRLRPRLHLIVGDEVPEKYVTLPLAKIRYHNEGFAQTDYVPPSLFVDRKSSLLGQVCDDLSTLLREKAAFLAEQVNSPASMPEAQKMFKRHQIHSMVGALGQFEAVLHSGTAHPYFLYLALCNLVGHVAAIGQALVPPIFDPYDHNDVLDTFDQPRAFIERVIQEGIQQTHEIFAFTLREDVFLVPFREEWFERKLVLGARTRSGMEGKDTIAWVRDSMVCTASHFEDARKRRVLGAEHRHVDTSEGLVPGRDMVLFELEADDAFITADEELIVTLPEERPGQERPAQLLLYVKN